ncbi:hypothetical protein OIV83_002823 [Microbotryomycetes sp. JL201]|nr:hypothetical protein OIV83_002823 [Microbotryomycetes sp. JL201]
MSSTLTTQPVLSFLDNPIDQASRVTSPSFLRCRSSTTFITLTVGLGVLVDLAGYSLIVPVVPFRLEQLGFDHIESKTGWLVASYGLALCLGSPLVAWLGMVIRNRRLPLIAYLMLMFAGITSFMETKSFHVMIISRLLQGFAGAGIWTLGLVMIQESAPEGRVGTAIGYAMIGNAAGSCLGPMAGGVLYERMGARAPYIFGMILVVADLGCLLAVIEKRTAADLITAGAVISAFEAPEHIMRSASEAEQGGDQDMEKSFVPLQKDVEETTNDSQAASTVWRELKSLVTSGRPMTAYAMATLDGIIACGLLDGAMTMYLKHQYGLGPLRVGLIFLAAVAPSVFMSPLAGYICDKRGAKGVCCFGVLACAITCPLLIIRGPLPLFAFFLVLLGTAFATFMTPLSQDLSIVLKEKPDLPATVTYGAFNMAFSLGSFVGPFISGLIVATLFRGRVQKLTATKFYNQAKLYNRLE